MRDPDRCARCGGHLGWVVRWRVPFQPAIRRGACGGHLASIVADAPTDQIHLTRKVRR